MPGRFLALVLALSSLCLAPAPVLAEDTGFYASAGASYYAIQLPDYAPLSYTIAGPFVVHDDRHVHDGLADGPMGGLTLGWKTEEGVFFEARGFYANPESHQHRSLSDPGITIGMCSLDGMAYSGVAGSGLDTSTKLSVDQYGGELLAGYEIPLAEGLSVSPFAGYYFLELDQDYSLLAYPSVGFVAPFRRSEKLDATYNGLEAGARLNYNGESVRARLAGTLGWAYVRTEYHGKEWETFNSSMTLHRDDWGARVRLEGGVDLPLGAWTLGLDAGVEYLSFVPGIVCSTDLVPTSLTSEDSVSGRVGLTIGYDF